MMDGVSLNPSKKRSFETKGQAWKEINDKQDFMDVMILIEATRTAKSHALNDRSSRSHCIVVLKQNVAEGKAQRQNKFTFVDLAGSERIFKSQSEHMKASEAKNINTSLSALGRVVNGLTTTGSGGFVPFRDSALTMLMKESLSGNCKTQLIVTVAEDSEMSKETISSLRFGLSCGKIQRRTVGKQKAVNTNQELA